MGKAYSNDLVKLVDHWYVEFMDVTVQEAKTQLSKLLRRVELGEEITIRRGKVPVAILSRVPTVHSERRIWGTVEGGIGPEFDEPLDDFTPFR